MDWPLNLRTPGDLRSLAHEAGFSNNRVLNEPTGVNLFLEVAK